jgi:HSP20 family protein
MAEKQQQHRNAQPDGRQTPQGQQASGQATQEMQRSGRQQTGLARRGGFLPSIFNMEPFDMFRMSPFALMRRFSEEMDQYFSQLGSGRSESSMVPAGREFFSPPVEVTERDGQFVVCADLPGLSKDDVHVEVTDDALLITGERRSEHEERQGGTFRSERSYGTFRRQIPLPEGVSADQATATFKDGVLQITMPAPKRQERSRRIEIQSASTPGGAEHSASAPQGQERSETTAR